MRDAILTADQRKLVDAEHATLTDLHVACGETREMAEVQQELSRAIRQLDELFLLVVVGEFNAGKSALINALLGRLILPEGVTPTTTRVTILKHGMREERRLIERGVQEFRAPIELLREIHIVDTPGTNAVIREHEVLTTEFVPRSDLVLFVTSADRPFSESERSFLDRIRVWGKKVVVVVNKVDILEGENAVEETRVFVSEQVRSLLGHTPDVFMVSARAALRAKQAESRARAVGGFDHFEVYLHGTLDARARIRLKLLNPLGVASHLVSGQLKIFEERLEVLRADVGTLDDIEAHLSTYHADMVRDFQYRSTDLDKGLLELEQRGQEFFDETLRFGRMFDLLNKRRIQASYQERVIADVPERMDRGVQKLIDWLVECDLRQRRAVQSYLSQDPNHDTKDGRLQSVGDEFHFDRESLLGSVVQEVRGVIDMRDRRLEAEALAQGARNAVAACAAVEAGALSVGTGVSIVAMSTVLDVTGIVVASTMALLGLLVIPGKRRHARATLHQGITEIRMRLARALRVRFEKEIGDSTDRIRDNLMPYSRFVRVEYERLEKSRIRFEAIEQELLRLKDQVDRL